MEEIKYPIIEEHRRDIVCEYSHSPAPNHLGKGGKEKDIAGLKPREKRNCLIEELDGYNSKFNIGFEIEKFRISRRNIQHNALIKGYEKDVSIRDNNGRSGKGVEAITHILPLLPKSLWRMKVYDLFVRAKHLIEEEYSQSNESCGGHITLSCVGMGGDELVKKMRKHSAVLLAIYRQRLQNTYCNRNLRMLNNPTYRGYKYSLCRVKDKTIEFRIPTRFTSVKQMMRRYELFYILMDVAVNRPNTSHDSLMEQIRPTLNLMYDGDLQKVLLIETLSTYFRKYIMRGEQDGGIGNYL